MVLIVDSVRCKARVLKAWYGCAGPENASVADVYREYSSRGLDRTTVKPNHILEHVVIAKNKNKIPALCA